MHAAALLVLPVVAYAASRFVATAAAWTGDRVTAAARLRRANRILQVAVGVGGVFLATASPLDDIVVNAVPGPRTLGLLAGLACTVVVGGVLPALAVHLGSRPAWRSVVGQSPDYLATVRRYLAIAALLTAPAFVVVAAWLAAPSGLVGVWLVGGTALAVVAGLPIVAAQFGPVRDLTAGERAVLPNCARGLQVRVVTTNQPVANAVAAGLIPGFRYVFVTDALLDTLDAEAAAAVVAHEAGHHRRGHVLVRFLATGLALVPLFLAASGVVAEFVPAGLASVGLLLAAGPVVRWTEFDADAYAARHVGSTAMDRALATLADRGLLPVERPPLVGLLSLHPSVSRRLDRLRDHNRF